MFLGKYTEKTRHVRHSKLGNEHEYYRYLTMIIFRCDNCGEEFEREKGSIDPKRLSNNYFHVCKNCNSKGFAQKRSVEKRKVWELNASSSTPISKL